MASVSGRVTSKNSDGSYNVTATISGLTYQERPGLNGEVVRHEIWNRINGAGSKPFVTVYSPNTRITASFKQYNCNPNDVIDISDGVRDGAGYVVSEYIGSIPISVPIVAPSYISYSSSLNVASSVYISWGTSTPVNGGTVSYILERSKNGKGFSQCYSGTATSCSDSGILQSDTKVQYRVKAVCGVSESPYKTGSISSVYYNTAPSTPASISVPTPIRGGQVLPISWATASDSNLSGYQLERATNGGAFSSIYRGSNRSYSDTAGADWSTVQYRVRAYDTYSAYSGYKTGDLINVIQNTPPVISGANSNLGAKTGAFNQPYTVTDADSGQTITVVEKIDSKQKRSFTAISGTQYSIGVTAAEWIEILNGSHTLTITATDSYGSSVSRSYTFSKNETAIELQLVTPLPSDERILRAIMNVTRTIPVTSIFTVEACNNGYDTTPTWVNVTDSVLSGNKFFFANASKTASKWGYNFKIKVQRNSASGDCYIQGIGGNFD